MKLTQINVVNVVYVLVNVQLTLFLVKLVKKYSLSIQKNVLNVVAV